MAVVSSLRALQSRSKRKSVTHSPNLSDHGNGASVLSQLLLTNPNANNRYVADMLDYPNVAAPFEYTRGVERAGLCHHPCDAGRHEPTNPRRLRPAARIR